MGSALQGLARRGLIKPPPFVVSNLCYEVVMGSKAYGVSTDDSDEDIYGFAIPPKGVVFPHLAGVIKGFGDQGQGFDQYQQHHVKDAEGRKEYDFAIYGIVKYFQLCMEANPNMVDSLFVPEYCVKHATQVGSMVRENRRLFLSKLCWPKFKGYAYSQLHKIEIKSPEPGSKRAELVERFGYDVKFAYHTLRLLDESRQILEHGDLDLQANREQLKSIRRGEWKQADFAAYADVQLKRLESIYDASTLRAKPDKAAIKRLLLECLETHYGSLDACVVVGDAAATALRDVAAIIDRMRIGGHL